jgi:hypothetical protein
MKTVQIDAIKVESPEGLPDVIRAADGHKYLVIGCMGEQTTCDFPAGGVETNGRRLCLILGYRVADPAPPEKAAGEYEKGSGV